MQKVSVFTAGKINLSLNILGIKKDMHLIDSVMATIDIGDIVTATKRSDNQVNISFDGINQDFTKSSTVHKTVDYLKSNYFDFGIDIIVQKNLPPAYGLGGSAADIAATLFALNQLFAFKDFNIFKAGADLGSDVPFLLKGGCCRVEGTGEKLTSVVNNLDLNIVIASAAKGCSSKDAFIAFDRLYPHKRLVLSDNNKLIKMLGDGDNLAIELCKNALTAPAEALCGNIQNVKNILMDFGAINTVMTGSGSAVVGFFADSNFAKRAVKEIASKGYYAKKSNFINTGTKII